MNGPSPARLLALVTETWQGIVALAALGVWLMTFWLRGAALVAVPAKLDSVAVIVRQHVDTNAKYLRVQARLQHRMLCVFVARTALEKEHCVLDDLGEP